MHLNAQNTGTKNDRVFLCSSVLVRVQEENGDDDDADHDFTPISISAREAASKMQQWFNESDPHKTETPHFNVFKSI